MSSAVPRPSSQRRASVGSIASNATCGRARMFCSLRNPFMVLTMTYGPSRLHQTTVAWGCPAGMTVTSATSIGPSSRSRCESGMAAGRFTAGHPTVLPRCGPRAVSSTGRGAPTVRCRVSRRSWVKVEYFHHSVHGNGALVAEEFKRLMAARGVTVNVHHAREVRPKELPSADLYLFSSPGRMGKHIGGMRGFLTKEGLRAGTHYAILTTGGAPTP